MWVFGYGSLIWKVDFNYEVKVVGYIKGYLRRFYQHSIDHRGVPGKPGRVVTLIPSNDPECTVWGVAYKIKEEDREMVMKHLDYREKNGYTRKTIMFYPRDKNMQPFPITLYIATADNESYAGVASIEDMAKQIINCKGPSGPNKDYVYNLAETMRKLAPEVNDEHLFDLEVALRKLDRNNHDEQQKLRFYIEKLEERDYDSPTNSEPENEEPKRRNEKAQEPIKAVGAILAPANRSPASLAAQAHKMENRTHLHDAQGHNKDSVSQWI